MFLNTVRLIRRKKLLFIFVEKKRSQVSIVSIVMLSFNLNLGPLPSYSIRLGYLWAVSLAPNYCNYVQSKVSNQHYFSRILYTKYVILIRLKIF